MSRAVVWLVLLGWLPLLGACGSTDGGDGEPPPPEPPPVFSPLPRLDAALPQAFARLGTALAVDGAVAVVGAPLEDDGGIADCGAAYVFRLVAGSWILEARLLAADGAVNDQFGAAVAVSGEQIVVGAPLRDEGGVADRGGAYVFRRTDPSAGLWEQTAILSAVDAGVGDRLGMALAIAGDMVLAGAPLRDEEGVADMGGAYVFRRSDAAGDLWDAVALLRDPAGAVNDQFGFSIALDADAALIGAPLRDFAGIADQGAAILYRLLDPAADLWAVAAVLTAADGATGDRLGYSVDLDGDLALAGAPFRDAGGIANAGAAYLFRRFDPGADLWNPSALLTAAGAGVNARLGEAVALGSGRALLGAPFAEDDGITAVGAAYSFRRTGADAWAEEARLNPGAGEGGAGDRFGAAVGLGADALVGAPFADLPGIAETGAVYPYRR